MIPQYSADGQWWWDGARWIPVTQPVHRPQTPPPARVGGWSWVRRIFSAVVGIVALLGLGGVLLAAGQARPIDPVRVAGTLTKVVVDCQVPADVGDQCAYLDVDRFCYRIAPDTFHPALPKLSPLVGRQVVFVVDKANYESSRTIGDPYCNFQVDQIIVTDSAGQASYSTAAMTEAEYVGHPLSGFLWLALIPSVVIVGLVGWNLHRELRQLRRS